MKSIEELLRNLARPDVLEFGLVTNRLPSINVGGRFEPVDDEAPSTDRVKQMLIAMGGARFIETLSDKPVQWTTRLDGIGVIAVAAIMRKDVVQARFTVARREAPGARPAAAPTTQAGPPRTKDPAQQAASPPPQVAIRPIAGGPQPQAFTRTQQGTGTPHAQPQPHAQVPAPQPSPQPTPQAIPQPTPQPIPQAAPQPSPGPQPTPLNPAMTKTVSNAPPPISPTMANAPMPAAPGQSSGKQPVAPPARTPPREGSITDEWDGDDDDDNEPTVQTLSPQNVPVAPPAGDPRPKPARRPEDVRSVPPEAGEPAAPARAGAGAGAGAGGVVAAPGAAETGGAAQAQPAAGAGLTHLAPPREPSGAPPATEVASPAAAAQGSLDDVDIEITTTDPGAIGSAAVAADDDDGEGIEQTVEVVPKKTEAAKDAAPAEAEAKPDVQSDPKLAAKTDPRLDQKLEPASEPRIEQKKPVTGAMPSIAHSVVPSTTPSGTSIPEKDRPRVDGAAALDSFLAMAVAAHATDLHLAGGRPLLLRVASDLVARTQPVSAEHVERIAKEVLPPRLREMLDGEGACDFAFDHQQHGRFRVNLSRHRGGTTIAIRVLGRDMPSLRALALPESIAAAARHGQGLVLVTGPAGHGKSTTLAALVDAINAEGGRHVCMIEEPIEHVHPRRRGIVTQREIGTHVKSWANAVDDALCSDVDVIVIGDIRDEGGARAAVTGLEAGRLVIATMSCTSAAKAIDRLLERFPTAEQSRVRATLASTIRLVVGQRLVPSTDRTRLHVALEVVPGTPALYALVRDGRTQQIPALQQRARSAGFVRLDDSLTELVRAQKVTLDVAKQFADSPADLAVKKG